MFDGKWMRPPVAASASCRASKRIPQDRGTHPNPPWGWTIARPGRPSGPPPVHPPDATPHANPTPTPPHPPPPPRAAIPPRPTLRTPASPRAVPITPTGWSAQPALPLPAPRRPRQLAPTAPTHPLSSPALRRHPRYTDIASLNAELNFGEGKRVPAIAGTITGLLAVIPGACLE